MFKKFSQFIGKLKLYKPINSCKIKKYTRKPIFFCGNMLQNTVLLCKIEVNWIGVLFKITILAAECLSQPKEGKRFVWLTEYFKALFTK